MRESFGKLFTAGLMALLLGCSSESESGADDRPRAPRHLVFVVLDTVRADRMTIYGHERDTTPFLREISGELLRFDAAKSAAPWTVPSHASMFTGLWPAEHRAQWGRMQLRPEHETLAEWLHAQGFCTVGLSANPLAGPATGLAQGFQAFRIANRTPSTEFILAELPRLLQQASSAGCRLFLFLNLMDAHIPYNTAAYGEAFGVEGGGPVHDGNKWLVSAGKVALGPHEREQHGAAYDAAVRYLDDAMRAMFSILRESALLDTTLVVLTSDHGEGLGAHAEVGHSLSVWEEQLAVPLLVRFPDGHRGGEVVTEPRSLTQLAPSLLDWLGLPRPTVLAGRAGLDRRPSAVTADYRSYFSETNRGMNVKMREVYPELASRIHHTHVLYCDRAKLMVDGSGRRQLYDLTTDPTEQADLIAEGGEALEVCSKRYSSLLEGGRFTAFDDAGRTTLDEADFESLRSLGYMQ